MTVIPVTSGLPQNKQLYSPNNFLINTSTPVSMDETGVLRYPVVLSDSFICPTMASAAPVMMAEISTPAAVSTVAEEFDNFAMDMEITSFFNLLIPGSYAVNPLSVGCVQFGHLRL